MSTLYHCLSKFWFRGGWGWRRRIILHSDQEILIYLCNSCHFLSSLLSRSYWTGHTQSYSMTPAQSEGWHIGQIHIYYPQCLAALGSGWLRGFLWPCEVCVSGREQAGLEVECIWRLWGCWWCGFQPTCYDRRPANQQQWHWEEDGGVHSPATPKRQRSGVEKTEAIFDC